MTVPAPQEPDKSIEATERPLKQVVEPEVKASWVVRSKSFIEGCFEVLDLIGQKVMGELWKTVYLSIQDAIALAFLIRVSGQIAYWISGKDFSSFAVCSKEDPLGPSYWACYIIVLLDFALWFVLVPRFGIRFIKDLRESFKMKALDAENSTREENAE
jgi:hypothetical protein